MALSSITASNYTSKQFPNLTATSSTRRIIGSIGSTWRMEFAVSVNFSSYSATPPLNVELRFGFVPNSRAFPPLASPPTVLDTSWHRDQLTGQVIAFRTTENMTSLGVPYNLSLLAGTRSRQFFGAVVTCTRTNVATNLDRFDFVVEFPLLDYLNPVWLDGSVPDVDSCISTSGTPLFSAIESVRNVYTARFFPSFGSGGFGTELDNSDVYLGSSPPPGSFPLGWASQMLQGDVGFYDEVRNTGLAQYVIDAESGDWETTKTFIIRKTPATGAPLTFATTDRVYFYAQDAGLAVGDFPPDLFLDQSTLKKDITLSATGVPNSNFYYENVTATIQPDTTLLRLDVTIGATRRKFFEGKSVNFHVLLGRNAVGVTYPAAQMQNQFLGQATFSAYKLDTTIVELAQDAEFDTIATIAFTDINQTVWDAVGGRNTVNFKKGVGFLDVIEPLTAFWNVRNAGSTFDSISFTPTDGVTPVIVPVPYRYAALSAFATQTRNPTIDDPISNLGGVGIYDRNKIARYDGGSFIADGITVSTTYTFTLDGVAGSLTAKATAVTADTVAFDTDFPAPFWGKFATLQITAPIVVNYNNDAISGTFAFRQEVFRAPFMMRPEYTTSPTTMFFQAQYPFRHRVAQTTTTAPYYTYIDYSDFAELRVPFTSTVKDFDEFYAAVPAAVNVSAASFELLNALETVTFPYLSTEEDTLLRATFTLDAPFAGSFVGVFYLWDVDVPTTIWPFTSNFAVNLPTGNPFKKLPSEPFYQATVTVISPTIVRLRALIDYTKLTAGVSYKLGCRFWLV